MVWVPKASQIPAKWHLSLYPFLINKRACQSSEACSERKAVESVVCVVRSETVAIYPGFVDERSLRLNSYDELLDLINWIYYSINERKIHAISGRREIDYELKKYDN